MPDKEGERVTMPQFLIEHGVMLFTVVMLAAFCFKHRDPRRAGSTLAQ